MRLATPRDPSPNASAQPRTSVVPRNPGPHQYMSEAARANATVLPRVPSVVPRNQSPTPSVVPRIARHPSPVVSPRKPSPVPPPIPADVPYQAPTNHSSEISDMLASSKLRHSSTQIGELIRAGQKDTQADDTLLSSKLFEPDNR